MHKDGGFAIQSISQDGSYRLVTKVSTIDEVDRILADYNGPIHPATLRSPKRRAKALSVSV